MKTIYKLLKCKTFGARAGTAGKPATELGNCAANERAATVQRARGAL